MTAETDATPTSASGPQHNLIASLSKEAGGFLMSSRYLAVRAAFAKVFNPSTISTAAVASQAAARITKQFAAATATRACSVAAMGPGA
jgi:hypothetical protein